MRLRYLMFVALLLAACNSILGNPDYRLVEATGGTDNAPATCRLNSNCTTGDVCIFQTCGPPCDGDQDCAKGSRCLQTDTGTACVSSAAATCDAGCPTGTTCSLKDGACRNACDTAQCLPDQTCSGGLCVGSDQHEAAGALEPGGGGTGGAPDSDACVGVVCNTPPGADCDNATAFKTYDKMGSCSAGVCTYKEHLITCSCEAGKCTTDPCIAVTCASPPDAGCKDADTLTTYSASGTCSAGSCSYAPKDKTCEFGCNNSACKPDPCAGKICSSPPAANCKNASTQTTYAATGTCSTGTCSYAPTDKGCESNQQCAGAGPCGVCKADASCGASCSACGPGTPKCKDLGTTSKCVGCLWSADCSGATPYCDPATNVCGAPPSCVGQAKTCGPAGNADCCASGLVTGGTFNRDNNLNYPATVANFRLDNYEITVGRFRKFVAAYSQTMIASGAGKNPNNASDTGWDTAWNASLVADATALKAALRCNATYQTWTDAAGSAVAESLPINCVDWFEAEAFCIWDGGRLPTNAEWNYAAAGGKAQRPYAWGDTTPDCSYANFKNGGYCVLPGTGGVNRVGSESTKGDGVFGQSDLGGNVWEWVQDGHVSYTNPCSNCANLTASDRVVRGGSFRDDASVVSSSARSPSPPLSRLWHVGARCARTP